MTVETNSLGPPWTILKILEWTRGYFAERKLDSPRLDAELLLALALDLDRVQLYTQFDRPLDDDELSAFRALVKQRALGHPVAYLVGRRGFWTFELEVDSRVLIPRPETETLIEVALQLFNGTGPKSIVDIGTGSGAIAIALALEFPNAEVTAADVSEDALAVARQNVERLAPRVELVTSDLFEAVNGTFDLIACNPPYVSETSDAVQPHVREHEPAIALFAPEDGKAIISELVPAAFERLNPGGWLAIEIGYDQGEFASDLFRHHGFSEVEIRSDLSGNERVVFGKRPV